MRLPPALREPQYRTYVLGNFFSLQGMWAQRTVIAWMAWELSGSASWVGLIAFLSFAPTLVSGPVFGVYADRADLRKAAMLVQAAMLAVSALLLALLASGALTIEALAAVALAQGVAISAHHPVRLALTPRLAPREALANAIAISSLNFNIARLTGPAAAGYAIALFGAGWTVAATVVLFVPVFAALLVISPRPAEGPPAIRASVLASLTEGARRAATEPAIRFAMLLTAIFALVVRGLLEILPVLADGVFARGASGLGEMMAAAGGGALLAAIFLTSGDRVTGPEPPPVTLAAVAGGFAATAAVAAAPVWPLALFLVAVTGFCGTMVGVTMQSVVQMVVGDAHRGRVMSLWIMVGIGAAAIGALLMGAIADLIGFGPTLLLSAALGVALTGALLLSERQRRRSSLSSASRNRDLSALEKGRPPPP